MKRLVGSLLLFFFPYFVFAADSSLSFTPPPGDMSILFLGNIFGVVDGVLHGTGSQIMGQMFGVFNSAVLALGGIIIMYTLIVSTMNTANEGQMLGQKWNSMWVPLRGTLGLCLLIPKASGYCVIQVFVMWVIVQGVGAADKVWSAALSYLNRGGVIVQSQMNPMDVLLGDNRSVSKGAAIILAGQTCMYSLQSILEEQQAIYQSYNGEAGKCMNPMDPKDPYYIICTQKVPNFLNSVNPVEAQTNAASSPSTDSDATYSVSMPNFESTNPYSFLNGICGKIEWNDLKTSVQQSNDANGNSGKSLSNPAGLSTSEQDTAKLSRAIAVQQLYFDLLSVSMPAVNNNTFIIPPANKDATPVANVKQYGVPYLTSGEPCTASSGDGTAGSGGQYTPVCASWGPEPSTTTPLLFNGTEFRNAITDYTAIMQPTLNLINQTQTADTTNNVKAFIQQANMNGWMMAGSYYFNLAAISTPTGSNDGSDGSSGLSDTHSGLDSSDFNWETVTKVFTSNSGCPNPSGDYYKLCQWLNNNNDLITRIGVMLQGSSSTPLTLPDFSQLGPPTMQSGANASTIYGYIGNSANLDLPNQPGLIPPTVKVKFPATPSSIMFNLPSLDFSCGDGRIMGICLPKIIGVVIYGIIATSIFGWIMGLVSMFMNIVTQIFIFFPMAGMLMIFNHGLDYVNQPNVNPIVGLANMGGYFINFCNNLWIHITLISAILMSVPVVDMIVGVFMALMGPLILAWSAVMMGIGVICAYYIPFVPYMIFTFASIAWLMAVIEAMVAAPIIALGISQPEGEGPLGKGEQAIMILMNVFLRPSMMIIGYISGIILSYVSVWIINAGFGNVLLFIQGDPSKIASASTNLTHPTTQNVSNQMSTGYLGWAGLYSSFFSVILYVAIIMIVVQRSFTMITLLPDKVLRWIGGQQESYGQDTSQWTDEAKGKVEKSGEDVQKAMGQSSEKAATKGAAAYSGIKKRMGGQSASVSDASKPDA